MNDDTPSPQEGRERSIALLRACATERGFLATPTERDNYRRVWGRDGSVMALAAPCRAPTRVDGRASSTR